MPQFDPTYFPSQIFWLLVCLSFFGLFMKFILMPRITQGLSARERFFYDLFERKNQYLERIKEVEENIARERSDQAHKAKNFMESLHHNLAGEKEAQLKLLHHKLMNERKDIANQIASEMDTLEAQLPLVTSGIYSLMKSQLINVPHSKEKNL